MFFFLFFIINYLCLTFIFFFFLYFFIFFFFFFFFQAEDGIRDGRVTGVQTCALPIWFDVLRAVPGGLPRLVLPAHPVQRRLEAPGSRVRRVEPQDPIEDRDPFRDRKSVV